MKQSLKDDLASILKHPEIKSVEFLILGEPTYNEDNVPVLNAFKGRMTKDMPAQFAGLFVPTVRRIFVERDYDLVGYDPSLMPDRKVIWAYSSSKVPFFDDIKGAFDSTRTPYYDDSELPYSDIWAFWIRLTFNNKVIYVAKRVTSSKVIEASWGMAVVFRGDTFSHLKEDVLTIDDHVDVLVAFETVLFETKQNFEKLLMYTNSLSKAAKATLTEIKNLGIVENFDDLEQMLVDDQHSIRKLNQLREKDYFKTKSFSDYHRIIKTYGIDVDVDTKNRRFNVKTKAQAKLLIKVLNDDFLKSELTDIKYSANSKESL